MSDATLRVIPVRSKRELDQFIDAAYHIRGIETLWTPPLRRDVKVLLDRARHPFHEHAQVEYFLAMRGDGCVGRIAAIENFAHNTYHEEKVGFFGFLDAVYEEEVFAALLEAAEGWARARGLTHLRGPCSFSTNEECGMLVDGFDASPAVMMPYNTPLYPRYIEACGYTKAKDLRAWWISEDCYNEKYGRLAEMVVKKLEKRGGKVTYRHLDIGRFNQELENVRKVYNRAWEKNWGFVPMTESEISFLAKELKPIIVPELVNFIEIDGEPIAFSFTLPDYNQAMRYMRGKLGPAEIALFLLLRNRITHVRMLTMGVVAEYRNRGIEALLIEGMIKECRSRGIHSAEMGWILEDNLPMSRNLENIGGRPIKTYRIFEKSLTP